MSRTVTRIVFYAFIAALVVVASLLFAGAMMAFNFPPLPPAHPNVGTGLSLLAGTAGLLVFAFRLAFHPLATPKALW
ncbi:hypothetical protein [Burkholderia cenocepacia]|uniref:hypothetical protein n=1 Tax=Burkholderia cenocepacia TaxID=95486 RepID=UPI00076CC8E3|nr:hypothetical protein [Burkholderia cenocepacia]KWU26376.1 hypothetical protein AS149_25645 [Burkholderia cenocepacia]